jgi:hypothetical protein
LLAEITGLGIEHGKDGNRAKAYLYCPKNWPRHVFGRWLAAAAARQHRDVLVYAAEQ